MHQPLKKSSGVYTPFGAGLKIAYAGRPFNSFDSSFYRLLDINQNTRVKDFAARMDVAGAIYMPSITDSNGRIASRKEFMKRSAYPDLLDSVSADGVSLEKGQSALFVTGDCPVVVMYYDGLDRLAVAAHAGRKSLIGDRFAFVLPKDNIIAHMLAKFPRGCRELIKVAIAVGIGGKHFIHDPKHIGHEKMNQDMIDFVTGQHGRECFDDLRIGALSLPKLIANQCVKNGIRKENIFYDDIDTYEARLTSGEYAFWSNRRGDKGRNVVLVSVE